LLKTVPVGLFGELKMIHRACGRNLSPNFTDVRLEFVFPFQAKWNRSRTRPE